MALRQSSAGAWRVDDDEIDTPIEVEVCQRRAARGQEAGHTGPVARFIESTVRLLQEQIVGGSRRAKSGIAQTLPLATKRSTRPSLLTSSNWACQAVEGMISPPV